MSFIINMLNLQLMLFTLIIIGILLSKLQIITPANRKKMSDLLIYIILPCNIINSFLSDLNITDAFFKNCILAVVISALAQVFAIYSSKLFFIKYKKEQKNVCSYGLICSNSSFIGLPVAESLYGSLGVLYTSVFQIPVRFTMWSAGLTLFTDTDTKSAAKKLVTHPCILAVFLGFFLLLAPVELPTFIANTISSISGCTTPLSMFVIGAILADADIKTLFNKHTIYFSFLRLIVFPAIVYLLLLPWNLDSLLVNICVIMTGMPAGSTTSILADQYGCDAAFAAQIIFVSTLLSILTIPVWGAVL